MSTVRYRHRQWSRMPWLAIGVATLAVGMPAVLAGGVPAWAWLLPLAVAPAAALFASLQVTVDSVALRWHFGPGFWRKSLPLTDVVAVAVTRTSWLNGWGIRWTSRGWLYNVAGLDAVLVTSRDGKARLVGSDEPRRLKAAIERALAAHGKR